MMITELRRIMIPLVGLQILGKQMILTSPSSHEISWVQMLEGTGELIGDAALR